MQRTKIHNFSGLLIIILFVLGGCNVWDSCESEYLRIDDFFIITQQGELVKRVGPNESEQNAGKPIVGPSIYLFNSNYVYSQDNYSYKQIVNYQTREPIYSIEPPIDLIMGSPKSNKLVYPLTQQEDLTLLDDTILKYRQTKVSFLVNEININTHTNDTLLVIKGGKKDRDKYEMINILAYQLSDDAQRLYYVQQNEIIKVSTDSAKTQVYETRFYFERSLWQYDFDSGETNKLLTIDQLESPYNEYNLSISKNQDLAVFTDHNAMHLFDLQQQSIIQQKEGRYSIPAITDDSRYIIFGQSSCSRTHGIIDLTTGEDVWSAFSSLECEYYAEYSIVPGTNMVIYTAQKASAPVINRLNIQQRFEDEGQEETPSDTSIINIQDHIGVSDDLIHLATVSRPVILEDGNILFHVYYQGKSKFCN